MAAINMIQFSLLSLTYSVTACQLV